MKRHDVPLKLPRGGGDLDYGSISNVGVLVFLVVAVVVAICVAILVGDGSWA
jgi:hypothetical protein